MEMLAFADLAQLYWWETIDWTSTVALFSGVFTTVSGVIFGFVKWVYKLKSDDVKEQLKHSEFMAETQRTHEIVMAKQRQEDNMQLLGKMQSSNDRCEATILSMTKAFTRSQSETMTTVNNLSQKVGQLGDAITELRRDIYKDKQVER